MKKNFLARLTGAHYLMLVLMLVLPLAVMAADVVPMPTEDGSLLEWILAVLAFAKGAASGMGGWAIVAGLLKLVVDATKTQLLGGFFDKLGSVGKLLVVTGASALLVGVSALASGASFWEALAAVVASSSGAVFLNEIIKAIKNALGLS